MVCTQFYFRTEGCNGGACTRYNRLPNNIGESKSSTIFLTREDILRIAFFKSDQRTPAGLVRILLFRAGIELNPGPVVKYVCPVCKSALRNNSKSVQCSICSEWIHVRILNNCSGLKSLKQYTPSFKCSSCTQPRHTPSTPAPTQPAPPPPTHP